MELPDEAVDLGHGTYITHAMRGDVWVGVHEWHQESGKWTAGFIPFQGRIESPVSWEVISEDPLTLSPSLACQTCDHHGFVRNGRWEPC